VGPGTCLRAEAHGSSELAREGVEPVDSVTKTGQGNTAKKAFWKACFLSKALHRRAQGMSP
jgi:hypothetical protein